MRCRSLGCFRNRGCIKLLHSCWRDDLHPPHIRLSFSLIPQDARQITRGYVLLGSYVRNLPTPDCILYPPDGSAGRPLPAPLARWYAELHQFVIPFPAADHAETLHLITRQVTGTTLKSSNLVASLFYVHPQKWSICRRNIGEIIIDVELLKPRDLPPSARGERPFHLDRNESVQFDEVEDIDHDSLAPIWRTLDADREVHRFVRKIEPHSAHLVYPLLIREVGLNEEPRLQPSVEVVDERLDDRLPARAESSDDIRPPLDSRC